jgi:hypothetical protein
MDDDGPFYRVTGGLRKICKQLKNKGVHLVLPIGNAREHL